MPIYYASSYTNTYRVLSARANFACWIRQPHRQCGKPMTPSEPARGDCGNKSPPCASPQCTATRTADEKTQDPDRYARKHEPCSQRRKHGRRTLDEGRKGACNKNLKQTAPWTSQPGNTTEDTKIAHQENARRARREDRSRDPTIQQRDKKKASAIMAVDGARMTTKAHMQATMLLWVSATTNQRETNPHTKSKGWHSRGLHTRDTYSPSGPPDRR